ASASALVVATLVTTAASVAAAPAEPAPIAGGRDPLPPRPRGGAVSVYGRGRLPRRPFAAADDSRSLALVRADPLGGQTLREATGGIHSSLICDETPISWLKNLYFCNFQDEAIAYGVLPSDDLVTDADADPTGLLTACPDTREGCHDTREGCHELDLSKGCHELALSTLGLKSCLENCDDVVPAEWGEPCSYGPRCASGLFCQTMHGKNEGSCQPCPSNLDECLDESTGSASSKESCLECKQQCDILTWGDFTVDGEVIWAHGMSNSALGSVVAPLVDCSDLVLDKVDICPGAKDSICLIQDLTEGTFNHKIAKKCEDSGGLAMVQFYYEERNPNDVPADAWFILPANIPGITISLNSGIALKEKKLGSLANVTTYSAGAQCWTGQYCSTKVPCIEEDSFCKFGDEGMDEGLWCEDCPEDPHKCYFSTAGVGPLIQNEVKACASACAHSIEFGVSCKTCGESITAFEFGIDEPSSKCHFCPEEDVKYPERTVPLFSVVESHAKCWQVQGFFQKVGVHKDSKNCKLAQLQNYICGCKGLWYAGANTQPKRNALVWVPRVTAILSGLGSSFVLFDVMRARRNWDSLFHQLMVQMALFDIIGSAAFAFTSLPIPSIYYVQGARGNAATCTAQGFFIQLGTIACFTNVSLAFYYFFIIQRGWSETQLKKIRPWLFLCPVAIGMAFAFAGIPFYDNLFLWCNNAADWWPDVPVALAILIATLVMGSVCWDVHKKYKASSRWRMGAGEGAANSLSTKVFWQSFWYLMAFYMTWPPYLALQYLWASGRGFENYSFILFAGTVVPLQGAWNCFVYTRNRQLKALRENATGIISKFLSRMSDEIVKSFPRKESEPFSTSATSATH
ncbi:hypothetical protein ACHAWF_009330, partial [Thalassiosira exigua]